MLNINYGHNAELMEQCKVLKEYAEFVSITKACISESRDRKEAFNDAVEYCIQNNILKEFLKKYQMEVLGMLLEEFDVDKYERSLREEGREEGRAEGRKEGMAEGIIQIYKETGFSKEDTLLKIREKLGLSEVSAKKYIEKYWK